MATNTLNLNLRKPGVTDIVNVTTDISDNMQKVDDAVGALQVAAPLVQTAYRNKLRNGDFQIAQRGTAITVTGLAFTTGLDGWKTTHNDGTCGVYQISAGAGVYPGSSDAAYAMQINLTGATLATHYLHLQQRIEGVRTLAGKTVTLSFIGYCGVLSTAKLGIFVQQSFGAGGGASAATAQVQVGGVTVNQTPTKYTVTFTVPSIVGKTVGTDGTDFLLLQFWLSGGSNYTASNGNVPIQNGNFGFADIQLEAGPVATPFERLPQQVQLAWNQRYYYRKTTALVNETLAVGNLAAATVALFMIPLPVRLRAPSTPIFNASSGTAYVTDVITANWAVTGGMTAGVSNADHAEWQVTFPTGTGTAGRVAYLRQLSGTPVFFEIGAEL